MKRRTWILTGGLATAAGVAGVCSGFVWKPLPSVALASVPDLAAPLRTQAEHDALQHWPYVVEAEDEAGRGRVLVLGIRHTNDPADPQIADLRRRFRAFAPTSVLVEGRLGWHFGGPVSLLQAFGESGEAVALATTADVPYASMEPEFPAEVADAVGAFGPAKTLAFYTLRVFVSERDRGLLGEDLDAEAAALLRKRGARTGLADNLPNLAALDKFWAEEGLPGVDWRELPARALWRSAGDAWTHRIAERVNAFRDRHFVAALVDAARRGERVLAVCGGSHAVLFEPALRAALR